MMKIVDIIQSKIMASIITVKQYPLYSRDTKQKDMQFDLQMFKKQMEDLLDKSSNTEKALLKLETAYLNAASKKKVVPNKSILKTLEEKFGLYNKANTEFSDATNLFLQAKYKFGSNKAAKPMLTELRALGEKLGKVKTKVQKSLEKIAETQLPGILDEEKNPLIEKMYDIKFPKEFKATTKELGLKKKKPEWGSKYFVTISPLGKKGLRFVRYDNMVNIPKTDKSTQKEMFSVLIVDLSTPFIKKKTIAGEFGPIHLTFSPTKVSPNKLPKSYKISNKKEVDSALSFLSYENGLDIFNAPLNVDPEKRLGSLKRAGKSVILTDPGVKVATKGNKIRVTIPKNSAMIPESTQEKLEKSGISKMNETQFIRDMFIEVKRLAGLPLKKLPAARHTTDRIKIKVRKSKNSYIFLFTILPKRPDVKEDDSRLPYEPDSVTTKLEEDMDTKDYIDKMARNIEK